jgi:spore germination protein GerM
VSLDTTPDSSGLKRTLALYGGGAAAAVAAAGLAFLLVSGLGPNAPTTATDAPGTGAAADGTAVGTLYYVAEDGLQLVGVEREMPGAADALGRARVIVEMLLAGPPEPLLSPFPDGTRLRALYLPDGGDAYVDLSREATNAHSGGSLEELFTVYALVNALTTNIPEIRAVQILIDGREVDTLAGHVDLRHPLEQNMKWVLSPEDEAPSPAE